MNKLEKIKKTSKLIGKISHIFQIILEILIGSFLLILLLLFVFRNTVNRMIVESHTIFDFHNMGYWPETLASKGKIADAAIVFLISGILFLLITAIIMHFIVKIFRKFCNNYSPFLPEIIKDLKIVSILTTLLVLRNSIGLGILSGFIFWGMIQLYEYGCELQNLADETL